ncbi:NADPH-dependent FMN reductase [Hufsiella ginkgonis]|uniref:NADPH-dependent FMN reductase n=1 Tax=Hufsiella ginkgonis TaxID=2695274 RepID=A0A7K1Y1K4_9SPHI|nr:NADPH-dependent FMN reductase [Hufsiella ginkgonis]MXV17007.1 NADPH-dependent FMN reductase [Hufsiella ginkgonis]
MITLLAATNREESFTLKLTRYYQKRLAELGIETNVLSLTSLPHNLISSDLYGKRSAEFQPVQDQVTATTKFLFVIPEYNGSFPGILKTFIDACKFPESFYGKKAALTGISSGKYGNIRGIDHFTGVCHYVGMHVMPLRIHIPAIHKELDEHGNLFMEDTLRFTNQQINQFITF